MAGRTQTVESIESFAIELPTERGAEADGTLEWGATTMLVVEARSSGRLGLGYTYTHRSAAELVRTALAGAVHGTDAMAPELALERMRVASRNFGTASIVAMAISAVDVALWDLKARLLDVALVDLLGSVRETVPIYGSGGFVDEDDDHLAAQLKGWVEAGMARVKIKVGRDATADERRIAVARAVIGDRVELFVDANGAYDRKQAVRQAERFAAAGVRWLEEPVPQDDADGLAFVRRRSPSTIEIASGEYAYELSDVRRLLPAVDVMQVDATRCGGVTGFLAGSVLCHAAHVPLSAHAAPQLHAHLGCAALPLRHIEYFHDHVRFEHAVFDGVLPVVDGCLRPDRSRPGHGFTLKSSRRT